jgi:hypothetical protein
MTLLDQVRGFAVDLFTEGSCYAGGYLKLQLRSKTLC